MMAPWYECWVNDSLLEGEALYSERVGPWGRTVVVLVTCSGRRVTVADSDDLEMGAGPEELAALAVDGMWSARLGEAQPR